MDNLRKIVMVLLSAALTCQLLPVSAEEPDTVETTVTVNEASVIKPSDRRMLGINDGWSSTLAVKNNSAEINPKFVEEFKKSGTSIPLSRMSGSESQSFYWKDSIGDITQRGYYRSNTNGTIINHGLIEWITYTKQIDMNARFDFVINLNDTPENNADLIRFLCLEPNDPKAVGADGTNWAQKRIDLGVEETVVPIIELGNEYDYLGYSDYTMDSQITDCADDYIDLCRANMAAMKAVKSDLSFAPLMYTVPQDGKTWSRLWNQKIISTLGAESDYVAFHYYYHGGSDSVLPRYRMPEITDYINMLPAADRPRILFTEHALWTGYDNYTESERAAVTALKGSLVTAQVITEATNDSYTEAMMYHGMGGSTVSLDNHSLWHVISKYSEDGQMHISGIGELLNLFSYAYGTAQNGENVVRTTLSGNDYVDPLAVGKLTASAHTTADGGLNLVLVNNEASTVGHNITFSANGSYKLEKEYLLTADDIMADNTSATPEGLYTRCNLINSDSAFNTYYIPPKCAAVLKLVPIGSEYEDNSIEIEPEYAQLGWDGIYNVESNNGVLGFNALVYANRPALGAKVISLAIFEDGTEPVYGSSAEQVEDTLVYTDIKNVFKERAYFGVKMPETATNGVYTAVFTTAKGRVLFKNKLRFRYTSQTKNKYLRSVSVAGEYNDGIVEVSNDSYSLDCKVAFSSLFPTDAGYSVIVKSAENDEIVYSNVEKHSNALTDTVSIKIPKDAIVGLYRVTIDCGENETAETLFDFKKPKEKIIFNDLLKNEIGEKLTLSNFAASGKLCASAKNTTSNTVNTRVIVAAYDNEGTLLWVNAQTKQFAANAEETIEADLNAAIENINTVRVYVWDDTIYSPYTEVYNIK